MPTCYPGIVMMPAVQLDPPADKWADVDLEGGEMLIDERAARLDRESFTDKPRPTRPFTPAELSRLKRPAKRAFSHALAAIACSGAYPAISAKTPFNQGKAAFGRIFRRKKRCPVKAPWGFGAKPGVWKHARKFIHLLLPGFRAGKMGDEHWIQSMEARRKRPLSRALDKLRRTGWLPSYAKFKAFLKTELLPGFSKTKDGELGRLDSMMDRVIQGPHDASHCCAGPYLKPLLKKLKEIWNEKHPIFYGSAGPEKLHKFLRETLIEGGGVEKQYFWMDFTNFENTHTDDSWDFMEDLYRQSGITDPLFWKAMKAWRRPCGRIGPFKYKARVMNSSGRDDTALANAVLNGFASYLSACAAYLEKDVLELTEQDVRGLFGTIKMSVCGDDSIGVLPNKSEAFMQGFRERMAENILQFGFETKLNTSTRVSDAVYLGMRPYPTKAGWFWGKTIGRSTYKMGWAKLKNQSMDIMAHITGVADQHVLCSSHVPILSDLAKKIVSLRAGAKRTPVRLDPEKPWEWTQKSGVPYDEITLEAVAEMYTQRTTAGLKIDREVIVSVDDVRDLINKINSVERLPCVLDHWLWKHMIYADEL